MRRNLVLLGALLVLAPLSAAEAAPIDLRVPDHAGLVRPLAETLTAAGEVHVDCGLAEEGPVEVRLRVASRPAWAQVTLSPSVIVVPEGCDGVHVADFLFHAQATSEAPAFDPQVVRLAAEAGEGANATSASAETRLEASFFGIVDAQAVEPIREAGPQTAIAFPFVLENHGNGLTRVTFTVLQSPAGWQVVPPQPVVLESRQAGGTRTSLALDLAVQTPFRTGYMNEVGAITLGIATHYALDPAMKGDAAQLSFLATVRGWHVPDPGAAGAVAAIALAAALALVARRPR